jgi:hypothetical protein
MNDQTRVSDAGCESSQVARYLEVYTDGTDRRAHARALLREISPGAFLVIPTHLREVCGPDVRWYAPSRGAPIPTVNPMRSRQEAESLLAWWAMKTIAENARAARVPAPSLITLYGVAKPSGTVEAMLLETQRSLATLNARLAALKKMSRS